MPLSDQGNLSDAIKLIPRTLIFLTCQDNVLLIKGTPLNACGRTTITLSVGMWNVARMFSLQPGVSCAKKVVQSQRACGWQGSNH